MRDFAIKTEQLTHIYAQGSAFEKKALDNINIEIESGAFVGIIGHTGSGKSTFIQHLNSLLKPTSGTVFIDNENINEDKSKLKDIRQKVGLVFQYPEHQLFETTVYKDVAFGPKNMGLSEEEIDIKVRNALALVEITEDLYEKSPFELSGGQKRRVAIAGIIAMGPDILVLDEPTAGLDPKGRDDILEQIRILHEKTGNTIILVSHSMEDVARLVDKIIVFHEGKIEYTGTPKEVFAYSKELEEIGLGAPQVSYLVKELKATGIDINTGIYTTQDAVEEIYNFLSKRG